VHLVRGRGCRRIRWITHHYRQPTICRFTPNLKVASECIEVLADDEYDIPASPQFLKRFFYVGGDHPATLGPTDRPDHV
jgi:hypothetical protein